MNSALVLSDEELSFFRLTLDVFPHPESPLRYLQDDDIELDSDRVESVFTALDERGLLNPEATGASEALRQRLLAVCECEARITFRRGGVLGGQSRTFYVANQVGVEYERGENQHLFGEPLSEDALAARLAAELPTTDHIRARPLSMTAGDYLVFAVFARDLRSAPPERAPGDDDAPMSIDEILSYFDEPETKYLRTPSDESWEASVRTLCRDGVLVATHAGYELHPSLHEVARQIVADHQHTLSRFDYFDDQWLLREVSLYPTQDTVYRLGTQSDGSVVIEELSTQSLRATLGEVIKTLPDILGADPLAPGRATVVSPPTRV